MTQQEALFEYCLRIGDNAVILGQRISEWSGHGPILEEDIAMSNMSLDLIGQARGFYTYAGAVEGKGRSEDDLAFLRDEREFHNFLMVEQPNGDFGNTMMRSFLYGCFAFLQFKELMKSKDETVSGLAAKSLKEVTYHVRHSGDWIVRLGDGTEESHQRMENAVEELWSFTNEFFETDEVITSLTKAEIVCDHSALREEWMNMVQQIFSKATLQIPAATTYQATGGLKGLHSEHLGHLLAEMQYLQRTHPGATW
jgi:ring-1,2-phenylacetyl-CoA epoxidase subunit PaaC